MDMDPYGSNYDDYMMDGEDGSDHGSQSGNQRRAEGGSLPLSCKECRASKVKCERVFPCARCSRLGLSCSPQVRKKRRQPVKPAAAPAPTFPINTSEGVRYLKHTPISALVKAFFELKDSGQLNRARALCVFRSWARVRELYGLKALEVVQDMMLKGMGVNDWRDLLRNEDLIREMSAYTGDAGAAVEETDGANKAGKSSGTHAIDSLPFFLKELFYSTNCASKLTICEDVLPVSFANDLFDRLFNPPPGSSDSLFYSPPNTSGGRGDASGGGMSLSECMIRAIHPTDGAELFTLIGNMFYGGQSNPCGISHIVRCRTARGESFMAMVRARFYIRDGGRFWANNVTFQPLPMSRFLFPLAKPMGPSEVPNSHESTFASLSVFEEPAQPQSCKTCEVMTKEALSFHFRALTEAPKPESEQSAEDMFVSQASLDRIKLEEEESSTGGGSSSANGGKKARHVEPPAPAPVVKQAPTPSPRTTIRTTTYVPPVVKAAAAAPVLQPEPLETFPLQPPIKTRAASEGPTLVPSFALSPSEVEVLDAFLAVADDNDDLPQPSWDNWEQSAQVGEDFWQAIGGFPVSNGQPTPPESAMATLPQSPWGLVTE